MQRCYSLGSFRRFHPNYTDFNAEVQKSAPTLQALSSRSHRYQRQTHEACSTVPEIQRGGDGESEGGAGSGGVRMRRHHHRSGLQWCHGARGLLESEEEIGDCAAPTGAP